MVIQDGFNTSGKVELTLTLTLTSTSTLTLTVTLALTAHPIGPDRMELKDGRTGIYIDRTRWNVMRVKCARVGLNVCVKMCLKIVQFGVSLGLKGARI